MKILFMDEDPNCQCEGSGWIYRTVKAPADFDPEIERAIEKGQIRREDYDEEEIDIRIPCPDCTEFKEATLKKFDDRADTDMTEGQVVPEEDFSERYKRGSDE